MGRPDAQPMVFAHGFGCDQNMWRFVAPAFEDDFRVVLFDHVGAGGSDPSAYDARARTRRSTGTPTTCSTSVRELDLARRRLRRPLGVGDDRRLAARSRSPSASPSSCWSGPRRATSTTRAYVGGFSEADITELLESLESNYLGWSSAMAPVDHGQPRVAGARGRARPRASAGPTRTIARRFARVTFLSDNRPDLPSVATPDARPAVQRRRHRSGRGRRVRPRHDAQREPGDCSTPPATARNLSAPERDHRRDRRLRPCRRCRRVNSAGPMSNESRPGGLLRRAPRRRPGPALRARAVRLPVDDAGRRHRQGQRDLPHAGPASTRPSSSGRLLVRATCSPPVAGSTTRPTSRRCCACRAALGRSRSTWSRADGSRLPGPGERRPRPRRRRASPR